MKGEKVYVLMGNGKSFLVQPETIPKKAIIAYEIEYAMCFSNYKSASLVSDSSHGYTPEECRILDGKIELVSDIITRLNNLRKEGKKLLCELHESTKPTMLEVAQKAAMVEKGFRLPSWKEDVVIKTQFPDENSKMTAPYFYVESRFGRVPWIPTMIELFSKDFVIA